MPLSNAEMTAGRYLRWQIARRRVAWIKEHLAHGHTVQVTTYTKATRFTAKHVNMFKATRSGAYVQRGKVWDCIDHTKLSAYN